MFAAHTNPGTVWVTEAAGWVAFGSGWRYDEARAARSIAYTFTLVHRYRAKITRWYFYQWRGVPKGARWIHVASTPDQ